MTNLTQHPDQHLPNLTVWVFQIFSDPHVLSKFININIYQYLSICLNHRIILSMIIPSWLVYQPHCCESAELTFFIVAAAWFRTVSWRIVSCQVSSSWVVGMRQWVCISKLCVSEQKSCYLKLKQFESRAHCDSLELIQRYSKRIWPFWHLKWIQKENHARSSSRLNSGIIIRLSMWLVTTSDMCRLWVGSEWFYFLLWDDANVINSNRLPTK